VARAPRAHHGEGLAGARLAVGEAGGAAPPEHGGHEGEAHLAVDLLSLVSLSVMVVVSVLSEVVVVFCFVLFGGLTGWGGESIVLL